MANLTSNLDSLETWGVLFIWIACDFVLSMLLALPSRMLVDRNGNGIVDSNELPKLTDTSTRPERIKLRGGSLYEIGLAQTKETLFETAFLCTSYSYFMVLLANWGYASTMDVRFSYLLTILFIFFLYIFLFAFTINTIHVMNSHFMHLFFYAFGYIPILLFSADPGWFYILGAIVAKLLTVLCTRFYVWPKYPPLARIVPLYITREVQHEDQVEIFSTPFTLNVSQLETYSKVLNLYVSLPIFEILSLHVCSSYAYGGMIGWATAAACWHGLAYHNLPNAPSPYNEEICFGVALLVSTLCSVMYMCCTRGYMAQKWRTLSVFSPKLLSFYAFFVGSGSVSVLYLFRGQEGRSGLPIATIGYVLHIFSGILLVVFPYLAAGYHFGFVSVLVRCFSFRGGNAGLEFTGERGVTVLSMVRAVA